MITEADKTTIFTINGIMENTAKLFTDLVLEGTGI